MQNNKRTSETSTRIQFYFLTFIHTVLDSYANLFPHLQPRLTKTLASVGSRNSFAGILISLYSIFSLLGQVFFGWLSDRKQSVHYITLGVAFTAVGLSLVGVIPSVYVVFLLLALGGLGVAAFHPQATTYAGALAAEMRGMGISIFLTGGNVGRAIGPVLLLYIPYKYGYGHLVWEMIPGVFVALLVPFVLKFEHELDLTASARVLSHTEKTQRVSFWVVAAPHLVPLLALFIIGSLRTVTGVGLENFLSIYLDDRNYTDQIRSLILALYIFAGSMGIMGSGWVLSKVHTLHLLLFSLVVAPPLLYVALHTKGIAFLIFLFLGNLVLSSSITLNIILAQMMLRGHENIASSFMMGASWGVGGLLNLIVGALGDKFGLPVVLDWLVAVPLFVTPFVVFLRNQPDLSNPKSYTKIDE